MIISKLLLNAGLKHYISGSLYDMRDNEDMTKNLKNFAKIIEIKPNQFYTAHQFHTSNIEYADGISGIERPYGRVFENTDGLITDKRDIALVVKFADCTPVVMYDPIKKVQAAVHSGWRGTVERISKNVLDLMVNDFGCNLKDILCFIGPSIDQENYEVGEDVYNAFENFENRDSFFKPFGEKYKLSMVDANLDILLSYGIPLEHIEVCRVSTFNTPELNSARRDNPNYKLNCMVTMME